MTYKNQGKAQCILKMAQQVENLRLARYVQARYDFIGNDQLRAQGDRAGNADGLALPTR